MPLYRYKCGNCGKEFTELRSVENRRKDIRCPECNCKTNKLVFNRYNRGFVLEPQWFEHIDEEPIFIRNKKHLKEECEKRGLEAKCLYD